jgi:hypothetical protein
MIEVAGKDGEALTYLSLRHSGAPLGADVVSLIVSFLSDFTVLLLSEVANIFMHDTGRVTSQDTDWTIFQREWRHFSLTSAPSPDPLLRQKRVTRRSLVHLHHRKRSGMTPTLYLSVFDHPSYFVHFLKSEEGHGT